MNERKVARSLGWFSIGLGLAEVVAGRKLGRALGLEDHSGLLRLYGLREIAAGVGILTADDPTPWVWARVAGDALDIATLAVALTPANPRRETAAAALGAVVGITAVDSWCAKRLHGARPHGSLRVHHEDVADGPTRHTASGASSAASE